MSEPARTGPSSDAARRLREATAGSIVAGLEPFDWDQDAAIAYEVAVDTIGLVIASYSGLIADEERRPAPDPARLQEWEEAITRATRDEQALSVQDQARPDRRRQIARATADRRALAGADRAEVARVSAAYAAEYRRLRQSTDALTRARSPYDERQDGAAARKETVMSQPSAVPSPAPDGASVSVLDGITAFRWSDEESVSYEAAVEAIAGLIGAYSARIAAERASGAPDAAAIAVCKTARAEAAAERARLDPADHAEVARVRAHYAAQTRRVRAGGA